MSTITEPNFHQSTPSFPGGQEAPWAGRVYQVAEWMQVPLYTLLNTIAGRLWTVLEPGKFGNYTNINLERVRRVALAALSIPTAILTVPTALIAIGLNLLGDRMLGSQPYLYFKGDYSGTNKGIFATWNMSTFLPNMTLSDGVEYSSKRLDNIAGALRNFQFVCGQEVDGASARFLAQKLKSDYKEFYTYLGKSNAPLLSSGLFFASKEKVINVKVVPFTGPVQTSIKRELVIFELKDYCVAMMHLDSGKGDLTEVHLREIRQAINELRTCSKPVILCGDLNEDRYKNSPAYQALVGDFVDCIQNENKNDKLMTCTDALEKKRFSSNKPISEESIDYITCKRDQKICDFSATSFWDDFSDHYLLIGKFTQTSTT